MSNLVPTLTPTRRKMLRLVESSEIMLTRDGTQASSYYQRTGTGGQGPDKPINGYGRNALDWLDENGYIHCLGKPGLFLKRTGLMRLTERGRHWLADNPGVI